MKAIKISITIALLTTLILSSCSEDDSTNFTPSASDIITTIDENSSSGTTIGTVATNLTGTLSYSITSQSVPNSFNINSTTGVVTINDASNFDFETNTLLTASVTVTNSSETAMSMVEVTLNDIDDIAFFLSSSRSAYEAAANGEWIMITEDEYNLLATNLNEVVVSGTTESDYNASDSTLNGAPNISWANNNDASMPAGSFIFAFKYTGDDDNTQNVYVKHSETSLTEGYANFENPLPSHNSGENFFVIKGNNLSSSNPGYLGIFATNGITVKQIPSSSFYFSNGDNATISTLYDGYFALYQGLSTTQKQWD